MKRVLGIILGGGAGTRLYPLTKLRAKPAVPLAGKYRLIDIPISNCVNSDINKIYVLTQFNSASLNRHITRAYNFSGLTEGFVEVLAAQQTPSDSTSWFQGTADAVRKYLWLFEEWSIDQYLILSGDHLYRMDYRDFVKRHRETGADITLSVVPIDEKRASDFGLMKIDQTGRVIDFSEKPKGDALKQMAVDTTILGLSPEQAQATPYIASMGIYVFNKDVMHRLLHENPQRTDFGKEIIPACAKDLNVQAYLFNGYWEDIGTIEAFYDANLALTRQPHPPFSFYDEKAPIYTRTRFLPPSKLLDSHVTESIIAEGCIIKECRIDHSVVGVRSRIEANCIIEDALLMGSDFYEPFAERQSGLQRGGIPLGIGSDTTIRRAIVDKNARIGRHVQIINKDRVEEAEREDQGFYIRNGIVVVMKNATIPDHTTI
ncbi:glucose-1-phosphate adenylyltransferase [Desertifilum sp. FACHB-1129]|uniref:Glucose-1-phosphate adenylyltransferase n=1 Tax=Desertifilum tharense IPPAS B-1220 TaxID=1781255 RepID=A0A1E5QQJ7_9CYAN|nr:glucose-1-phosphate adenylyltransferase [Desertifilum tharense]MBD2311902.1 glucose-1-phosphate adenylyltransferase [Desertifilum sp. FACHB-1129]MBD2323047.1 glucose-1-phosphate adenylyltransferase [Desertifilum sp. FACHB-866]MBD2333478.1 glucose-1-phosphate adenylyltransferase [Desertifilum sp. FACHB-868]MCD8485793.1 glucose-1-phosphate adenylyltransferase [Desertifilum sp.]MDA0209248.1 glucose-1-phosphate adenylyltransferase [Cyanobacteria bacterium FC1]MDI9636223.1 glucose-1-phosphate a